MDERSGRIAKRFEVPILVAALLVIPVIVIEEPNVSHTWNRLRTALTRACTAAGVPAFSPHDLRHRVSA